MAKSSEVSYYKIKKYNTKFKNVKLINDNSFWKSPEPKDTIIMRCNNDLYYFVKSHKTFHTPYFVRKINFLRRVIIRTQLIKLMLETITLPEITKHIIKFIPIEAYFCENDTVVDIHNDLLKKCYYHLDMTSDDYESNSDSCNLCL